MLRGLRLLFTVAILLVVSVSGVFVGGSAQTFDLNQAGCSPNAKEYCLKRCDVDYYICTMNNPDNLLINNNGCALKKRRCRMACQEMCAGSSTDGGFGGMALPYPD